MPLGIDWPSNLQRAGEGIRTLDMQLGKLPLCQLSYTRIAQPLLFKISARTLACKRVRERFLPSLQPTTPKHESPNLRCSKLLGNVDDLEPFMQRWQEDHGA